jgi:hypothetical protein
MAKVQCPLVAVLHARRSCSVGAEWLFSSSSPSATSTLFAPTRRPVPRSMSVASRSRGSRRATPCLPARPRERSKTNTSSEKLDALGSFAPESVSTSSQAFRNEELRGYDDLVDDQSVVSWQLGRPARSIERVAVRCPFGFPAVTEQAPFGPLGEPFPTTYYLTCPWLVGRVARIEAAGGVSRFSRDVEEDAALRASVERADAEQRRLRPELPVGIGGTRDPLKLKCLHAHVAFALARPPYELGDRVLAETEERWCPDRRCEAALVDSEPV